MYSKVPTRTPALALCVALLALSASLSACQESGLRALRADFHIEWPEEMGYVDGALDESALTFGVVDTGTMLSIPVSMSNPGNADLEVCETYLAVATFDSEGVLLSQQRTTDPEMAVVGAEVASSGPSALMELSNGSRLDFEIRFTPLTGEPLPSDLYFVVRHENNSDCADPDDTGLFIPVSGEGFGVPVPDIHADPALVQFANLNVGQTSDGVDVRVMNLGPGTLDVFDVVVADDTHFSVVTDLLSGGSYEQNQEEMIRVQFHPQAAGTQSTEVLITSNDPDEDPYPIQLVGIADEPQICSTAESQIIWHTLCSSVSKSIAFLTNLSL